MATTSVGFILQNSQTALNGAAVTAIPYADGMESKAASLLSGRWQGGGSYNKNSASATKNIIRLDAMVTDAALLGYAKNGVFHVTTSGTTGVTIDLTNLATGATSTFGDVTFATWNLIIAYNLSGIDGVAAAAMTLAPGASNPLALFTGTTPTIAVAASSRVVVENTTGGTVDSTHKTLLVTPTAGGNFALVVCGS